MNESSKERQNLCQHIESQLSGYLDNELTQQDSQRIYLHLEQCAECKKLHDELLQVKQLVSGMEEPKMSEKELNRIMADAPSRTMATVGWILLIVTIFGLAGYATFMFFMDDSVATWFKIVKSILVIGFALLLGSVIRQRFIARKTDKYKKVNL